MSSAIRSSLDRLALGAPSNDGDLLVLRRRAYTEQGIAVIDLGKIRSRDWPIAKLVRQEVERQLRIEKRERG